MTETEKQLNDALEAITRLNERVDELEADNERLRTQEANLKRHIRLLADNLARKRSQS